MAALKHSTETNGMKFRVVNTSSSAFDCAPGDGIIFDLLKDGQARDAKIRALESDGTLGQGPRWVFYGTSNWYMKIGPLFTILLPTSYIANL